MCSASSALLAAVYIIRCQQFEFKYFTSCDLRHEWGGTMTKSWLAIIASDFVAVEFDAADILQRCAR